MDSPDVQKMANVAYVSSQIASAYCVLEAMKAENALRLRTGHSPAYGEKAFMELVDQFQLGHNAVLTNLRNGL